MGQLQRMRASEIDQPEREPLTQHRADMIEFELAYAVADINAVDAAQNELFDRAYKAASAAGIRFAPRLGAGAISSPEHDATVPNRLLAGVSLFSTLTGAEKLALAREMARKDFKLGELVVRDGTVLDALSIVSDGVLVATEQRDGKRFERLRLTPGVYFGETGLLTGAALRGEITALTRVTVYEISKNTLLPLLKARPTMAEELSELLTARQRARQTVLDEIHTGEVPDEGITHRVTAKIRQLFSLSEE
jgi:CRP-like cAMP-binding protein